MTAKNYYKAYRFHGVDGCQYNEKDLMGNCRFCGDQSHFSYSSLDGRYRCFKCECRGNLYTFMNRLHLQCFTETTSKQLRKLGAERGLSVSILREHEVAWDDETGEWLIPHRVRQKNPESGEVSFPIVNLKRWQLDRDGKRKLFGTKTCKNHVYGAHLYDDEQRKRPTYVCEGEWDRMALCDTAASYLGGANVVALPGTGTNLSLLDSFSGRIICLGDSDPAGRRLGILVSRKWPDRSSCLVWTSGIPGQDDRSVSTGGLPDDSLEREQILQLREGFDVRDLCNSGLPPEVVWKYLQRNLA